MIKVAGLETSLLSLGTMTFGMQCDYEQSARIMDMAVDNGINFFDTAELYATPTLDQDSMYRTEKFIGKWRTENKAKGHKIVMVSKVMGPTGGDKEAPPTQSRPLNPCYYQIQP